MTIPQDDWEEGRGENWGEETVATERKREAELR